MKENSKIYNLPNMGCMIGTAYQIMVAQLDEALKSAGLPIAVPEYLILRVLYDYDGLQQCEIASALGKDKAAVCRTVGAMVKKGLVTTQSVSHKCLRLFLSPKAEEMKPSILEVASERENHFLSLGTREEIEIFSRIIKRIIEDEWVCENCK